MMCRRPRGGAGRNWSRVSVGGDHAGPAGSVRAQALVPAECRHLDPAARTASRRVARGSARRRTVDLRPHCPADPVARPGHRTPGRRFGPPGGPACRRRRGCPAPSFARGRRTRRHPVVLRRARLLRSRARAESRSGTARRYRSSHSPQNARCARRALRRRHHRRRRRCCRARGRRRYRAAPRTRGPCPVGRGR